MSHRPRITDHWSPILSARADCPARRAELASVLVDHRRIPAFRTFFSDQRAVGSGVCRDAVVLGDLQHAHLAERVTALVEHTEHGVAVDDEPGNVGHRAREMLLALTAGHTC